MKFHIQNKADRKVTGLIGCYHLENLFFDMDSKTRSVFNTFHIFYDWS